MASRVAKVYIGSIIAIGAAILLHGLWNWHTEDWPRYLFWTATAAIASGMKVALSGGAGTMSMNFLFVLIGIEALSQPETLILGCLGIVVQRFFNAQRKPTAIQYLFNVASMACSIAAAYNVYGIAKHAGWFEPPVLLLLAAGMFFLVNTFSVALVIALTEQKSPWSVWKESYLWSFPNYLIGAAVAWVLSAASRTFGWQASLLLLPILYVIYRSHRLYVDRLEEDKRRAEEQRTHAVELAALHRRTIEMLALAVEAKDQTTSDHLARVEIYAREIGKDLGLSENQMSALEAASLLHDIGKLAVPEYIISKPGKLTPEEFEKMKIHPIVGAELLEQVQFPYPVAPIVRSHHEKWDGSGYPDGLVGDAIPIGARILAAVDCLDALSSDRQYRRALPLDEAINVVRKESGKAFDPQVVDVLSRRYIELERLAKASMAWKAKLSTNVKVERGAAPAAGFEDSSGMGGDLASIHQSIAEAEAQSHLLDTVIEKLDACTDDKQLFETLRISLEKLVSYQILVVYARQGERLVPKFLHGEGNGQFANLEIPMGMGLTGWVAENGKPILNGNPAVERGYLDDPKRFSTMESALAVPLESQGNVWGVLSLYRRNRDAFNARELRQLLSVGARVGRALDLVGQIR